ncbi:MULTISPECIES: ROK family protein [Subtercola]|uniref:ROK family protein n=1 Tax=Subtercola vilae TaxID=2056433 RepID=A0A4T2C7C3_9MICO|nr:MULTISPECIES: ROK family protein [Subtercola]MEA9986415.1 ROK family protein [Subtercola sp. RTI3]TIH40345.1 ROK family protein [Subtercola vilae]
MRIGIDIGGTKTDAVAIDDGGVIVDRLRLATGFGAAEVVNTAVAAVTQLLALPGVAGTASDDSTSSIASIGIGIPGTVDSATGHVSHAVNLGLDELDLGDALERRLGVRVRVENDVKAAALGAYSLLEHTPAHAAAHTMAYLNLGTGLAAGLVLGGELWRGSWGAAGEIGHIPIDPAGALCPCGQRGCLETVASGSAIARQWSTDDQRPAQSLFAAADAGDLYAVDVRQRFIEGIASAVRVLVLTVDVDVVVIGGGLSNLGTPLLDAVHGVLAGWALASPFIASLDLGRRVELLPEGFPAAAVGAALVGIDPATSPTPPHRLGDVCGCEASAGANSADSTSG